MLDTCALPYGDQRGIRLGTAAVTTQGMGEEEMGRIAALFTAALDGGETKVRRDVNELVISFPPYGV